MLGFVCIRLVFGGHLRKGKAGATGHNVDGRLSIAVVLLPLIIRHSAQRYPDFAQ